ncbi:hypothetical protein B0H13DRAFT_1666157 [Mycena leptocephala]|nr:hypothetical protein B0H13DRAFT_1666157 [Mycena leptocephala]
MHSNSFTSLQLHGSTQWSDVWNALETKRAFHLTEISTDSIVSPSFLAYLASYSGINRLKLGEPDGHDDSEDVAETFYSTVLPLHAGSLAHLSCMPRYNSRWSFGMHNVDEIANLVNLITLVLGVNPEEVIGIQPPMNTVVCNEIFTQYVQ